jgi:hypothetical protein
MFDESHAPQNDVAHIPLQSREIGQIAAALAKAQGNMGHAAKDSTNPHFRSNYADLASVISACGAALAENGISRIQRTLSVDGAVVVHTTLMHESGEFLSDYGLPVPVAKQDAQGYGSAITYGRRYTLSAMTGIAQDDDDGNAAVASTPGATAYATARKRRASPAAKPATQATQTQQKPAVPEADRAALLTSITNLPADDQAAMRARMKEAGIVWGSLTVEQASQVGSWVIEAQDTAAATA